MNIEKRSSHSYTVATFYFLLLPILLGLIFLPLALMGQPNWFFLILGFLSFVEWVYLFNNLIYKEMIGKKIIADGNHKKISATVIKIRRLLLPVFQFSNTFGNAPWYSDPLNYQIIAIWKDEREVAHTFTSPLLGVDPSGKFNIGGNINVYLDPGSYKKYFVDTRDLS